MWKVHVIKLKKEEIMMKIRNKKSSRTVKRALAFAMSFALAMSTLAVAPNANAAKKKAPNVSVAKKT